MASPTTTNSGGALNLARLGYVVLEPVQNHYEDLNIGIAYQTLMVWNNMRALDVLESLPEVDRSRIGVAAVRRRAAIRNAGGFGSSHQGRHHRRDVL